MLLNNQVKSAIKYIILYIEHDLSGNQLKFIENAYTILNFHIMK